MELVLDLDHTCVNAAELHGDAHPDAGVHYFVLTHGLQGEHISRYKIRVRDGLARRERVAVRAVADELRQHGAAARGGRT